MNRKTIFVLFLSLILLVACAQASPGTSSLTPSEVVSTLTPTVTEAPTEVLPTPTHLPVDLTPAQRAAMQALSEKYNIPIDQIQLVSTEAMTWENGCLGVVIPGVLCTKGPVEGFRIVLEANGQQYEFHTDQDGTNVVEATQQLASIRLAVLTSQGTIQLVDPDIPLGPTYNPAFNGFLPRGDSVDGTAYVVDLTGQTKALAVSSTGTKVLDFIKNSTYGLALWRGGEGVQPRLAWGTQLRGPDEPSSIQVSNLDGSQLETLLTGEVNANPPEQFVAELWSADGGSLYFSKEPVGLGGYISFTGASDLYKIDIASKEVTEIIPADLSAGVATCLDAISGDYRFVADHCSQQAITIRDLSSGETTTVQPPSGADGFRVLGSARFSPDGGRVAFALAKRNPDNEQGWVAVSDSLDGGSQLILTGEAGSFYTVVGWLDDQTLLIQQNCISGCENQLWTLSIDGSNLNKVADGTFLTVVDNR